MAELEALQQLIQQQALAQGESKGLEQQRANAMALRNSPAQQAGRRSGYSSPLGNIAQVLNSYSGNKQQAQVAPQIAAGQQAIAEGQAAQKNYALQKAVEQQQYDRGQDADALAMKTEQEAYRRDQTGQTQGLAAAALKAKQAKMGKHQEAWNIETGTPKQTYIDPKSGRLVDADTMEPLNAQEYTFESPTVIAARQAKGKGGKGGKKGDVNPMAKVAKPDSISRVLTNPMLGRGTGLLDYKQYVGGAGYGENNSEIQALHSDMAGVRINQVKSNLEGLGVNPTDKDLEVAFQDIPSKNTQPEAWVKWVENNYLPLVESTYNKAIADGLQNPNSAEGETFTRADRDAVLAQIRGDVAEGKRMWAGDVEDPNPELEASEQQQAPQAALDFLQANPDKAEQFKAKFGYLPEGA